MGIAGGSIGGNFSQCNSEAYPHSSGRLQKRADHIKEELDKLLSTDPIESQKSTRSLKSERENMKPT
ncbi:MAG: hypothetical protein M2R45_01465 [Verrucomicrobia subdivision 3 bacterium]|nr:hypothetical protein [Limisphaerales bacterium]MCS1413405.1 hypothetical protein [Limisphaerales bacterium]